MKKLFLTIISLLIITSTGCYNADTAKVRINLGNMPIAHNTPKSFIDRVLGIFEKNAWASHAGDTGVSNVHVAAYSGNSVYSVVSINADDIEFDDTYDYVELDVPAGENITILVVGDENVEGAGGVVYYRAAYYGSASTELKAGESTTVQITMETAVWSTGGSGTNKSIQTLTWLPHTLSWETPGVKVMYYLYDQDRTLLYKGYDNTVTVDYSGNQFYFYVEFEVFDLKTAEFSHNDT